ncbi:MAG: hypothetical protein QHC89_09150, partial [Bosea sp. (in: a-proteobacteria)]|nr:hypothetical protein [Bosea sp. (in: a-proteobacteria)]
QGGCSDEACFSFVIADFAYVRSVNVPPPFVPIADHYRRNELDDHGKDTLFGQKLPTDQPFSAFPLTRWGYSQRDTYDFESVASRIIRAHLRLAAQVSA